MESIRQKVRTEKYPDIAYLFDVDGVLTNPEAKKVTEPALFSEIIKRLITGNIIGFNTGRSFTFMDQEILIPLESMVPDKSLLNNIFAIGEKGAVWLTYDTNVGKVTSIDPEVSVPVELQLQAHSIVDDPRYSEFMFYDETKRTMVTIEMKDGKTIAEFSEPQLMLAEILINALDKHPRGKEYRVDLTRIAVDIESIKAGKALGARRFVQLLDERKINPKRYISFGDTSSDYDMHEELTNLGKTSSFVFVGGKQLLQHRDLANVLFTNESVDKGTLQYLISEM